MIPSYGCHGAAGADGADGADGATVLLEPQVQRELKVHRVSGRPGCHGCCWRGWSYRSCRSHRRSSPTGATERRVLQVTLVA